MQVYKFGGASVKSSTAVENLFSIVKKESGKLLIVVSAMGKTTNALEVMHKKASEKEDYSEELNKFKSFHDEIMIGLFRKTLDNVTNLYFDLEQKLKDSNRDKFSFTYDQIICFGEIISTHIVCSYLNLKNHKSAWLDARKCIQTNSNWQEAQVNWDITRTLIEQIVDPLFHEYDVIVSQGFVGGDSKGNTTTLGREGSDFSAAIFGNCLNASSVTVWKDVDGILNKDPKQFSDCTKFDKLSYKEIVEMSYYGASVIHPKTIKPLSDKMIPLYVKSFVDINGPGTLIGKENSSKEKSSYILKLNQCLLTFSNIDLSFTNEASVSKILSELDQRNIKTSLMQSSATTFSVCVDYNIDKVNSLISALDGNFDILYNLGLTLFTIKNYKQIDLEVKLFKDSNILLSQKSRKNIRFLLKSEN